MNNEKFYTLKNSSTKGTCEECEELADQIYPEDQIPDLPLHPNCACIIMEIPALALPKYIINLAKEKNRTYRNGCKIPCRYRENMV
jgi:hypothetical protein